MTANDGRDYVLARTTPETSRRPSRPSLLLPTTTGDKPVPLHVHLRLSERSQLQSRQIAVGRTCFASTHAVAAALVSVYPFVHAAPSLSSRGCVISTLIYKNTAVRTGLSSGLLNARLFGRATDVRV